MFGDLDPHSTHLDLKGPLETTGKESPEGSHDGGKGGQSDGVDLERVQTHGGLRRDKSDQFITQT